ncbi:tRNA (N(6)-L-threonylcarbamoyladenosine(37)-C(2))-methylthiotransferase MtaB [bacterium]|nr:tRNA (N(6)-L-threonylcarbamoyladenosine(37)-C(2))-methylthiotransferase MtaB [bacterium]
MRIKVKAFGCKLTQCEAGTIERALVSVGHELPLSSPYDAVIVCGCTVTNRADYKVRQYLRRVRKDWGVRRLFLAGCSAVKMDESAAKKLEIEALFPSNEPKAIIDYLADNDLQDNKLKPSSESITTFDGRTRGFVKIQDGCNQFCSYCIVPYVRGRERSVSPDEVIKRVNELDLAEVKEAVLTGVHDGRYKYEGVDLAALCRKILAETNIFRLRLSSIEPTEITNSLIDLLADSDRLAPHLHVPLQAGSNAVLEKMRRPYNREFYAEVVYKLHEKVKNIGIGADVIVGFPGETESDFEDTYNLIESLPISYLHVFRYSPRKGTDAEKMPNQVQEEVKRLRMERLIELKEMKKQKFAESQIGIEQTVIVEKISEANICQGWTGNYIKANFISPLVSKNNIVILQPNSYESDIIHCEVKNII